MSWWELVCLVVAVILAGVALTSAVVDPRVREDFSRLFSRLTE